jgi:hypothetical protein
MGLIVQDVFLHQCSISVPIKRFRKLTCNLHFTEPVFVICVRKFDGAQLFVAKCDIKNCKLVVEAVGVPQTLNYRATTSRLCRRDAVRAAP